MATQAAGTGKSPNGSKTSAAELETQTEIRRAHEARAGQLRSSGETEARGAGEGVGRAVVAAGGRDGGRRGGDVVAQDRREPAVARRAADHAVRGDHAGELLDTLAAQVTPDADLRAWLVRSWFGPQRLIDGRMLDELAGAVGGRLARESRFRAWLRAEWTAWARQRYRRVARLAGEAAPA